MYPTNHILWGWKRDLVKDCKQYPPSRTVYFTSDFDVNLSNRLLLKRAYFYLSSRAKTEEIDFLYKAIGKSRKLGSYILKSTILRQVQYPGFSKLVIEVGTPSAYDSITLARLLKRKPRLKIEPPKVVPTCITFDIRKYAPFALYCGSGLSTESGLPLLGTIHNVFYVDDVRKGEFIFGAKDPLPQKIAQDVTAVFSSFCEFHVRAIKAQPSLSHQILANLWRGGIIKQVLTDNMDDIFQKVGIPYTQTRLSIFPDRFKVSFQPDVKSLLVIGIAVDRRDVIKQARRVGLKIIAINPIYQVAPYSRNIDYLYPGDIFFKGKAGEILPKIASYWMAAKKDN